LNKEKLMKSEFNLLDPSTPLVYSDGTETYAYFKNEYKQHDKGFFVLAPSGAGKTHFVKNQNEMHWLDGDELWMEANAHPDGAWWLEGNERIAEIDARCDVITTEAKKLGFWIVGASNNWLKPDAIVLPEWETHKSWIKHREENDYDGGATSDKLEQVISHREWIIEWEKKGVPKFSTVQEAAEFLSRS